MVNQKRLIKTFIELAKIDSPSGEEGAMTKEVAKRLKGLGGKVTFDKFGNIIAKFIGIGEPLMINAHLDTVEPGRAIKPIVNGDEIRSDGSTIVGGDDKAGLAVILEALSSAEEQSIPLRSLEVVLTLGEEAGLLGAINLDYGKVKAKQGVTFDGHGPVSNVTIAGPGYHRVDVTVIGRDAHAGAEPEKGISAIKIVSEIISQLNLGRIDEETTANVGLIEGGTARNAVPGKAHFKGEIRSRDMEKLKKHSLYFRQVFDLVLANYPEAKLDFEIKEEFGSYRFDQDHSVIQLILKIFKDLKIKSDLAPTGGGSDVNIFNGHGIEIVDVGIGVYDMHTTREYVVIPEMVQAAKFCEKLVSTLE